jgi:tRNA (guanine-N7-)-methyltransferase
MPNEKIAKRQLYGRRQGHKLRPHQMRLMKQLLPRVGITLPQAGQLNLKEIFPAHIKQIWLEVGFGGGEHLLWQALHNQTVGFIGGEPYVNGVAKLLTGIEEHDVGNIRIYDDDIRNVLDVLPDSVLAKVFLLFPDPWPKTRHHKRRFVSPENLDRLARVMMPGAELRIASDIADYIYWTMLHMQRHPGFEWQARHPGDWRARTPDWPETRYEQKAILAGRKPSYLKFHRVAANT